jgi:hypothetical protein
LTQNRGLPGLVGELAGRGLRVITVRYRSSSRAEKLTFKKRSVVAGERDRPHLARRRALWEGTALARARCRPICVVGPSNDHSAPVCTKNLSSAVVVVKYAKVGV